MMKREWAALAVAAALIATSIWNIRRVDTLTGEIQLALCKSKTASEQLNFKASKKLVEEGFEIWQENERYTQTFLTQAQVDETTQAFYVLMEKLSEEDIIALFPVYDAIQDRLDSIRKGENISVGSIF